MGRGRATHNLNVSYGGREISIGEGLFLRAFYSKERLWFEVLDYEHSTTIDVYWTGVVWDIVTYRRFATPLAKGLFHLGLLTHEVEAVLGVAPSHQKLEWALEFEVQRA